MQGTQKDGDENNNNSKPGTLPMGNVGAGAAEATSVTLRRAQPAGTARPVVMAGFGASHCTHVADCIAHGDGGHIRCSGERHQHHDEQRDL